MPCDEIREELEAFALGALDAQEQAKVAQHLAQCPDCQTLAQEYAAILSTLPHALATASPRRAPPSLKNRLLEAIHTAPVPRAAHPASDNGGSGGIPARAR